PGRESLAGAPLEAVHGAQELQPLELHELGIGLGLLRAAALGRAGRGAGLAAGRVGLGAAGGRRGLAGIHHGRLISVRVGTPQRDTARPLSTDTPCRVKCSRIPAASGRSMTPNSVTMPVISSWGVTS